MDQVAAPLKTKYLFLVLVLILVAGSYYYFQDRQLSAPAPDGSNVPVASTSSAPVEDGLTLPDPLTDPLVASPSRNSVVTSPLKVSGTVPPGWMFEGSFPLKLVDQDRNLIIQSFAQESVGGSWQKTTPIAFKTELKYVTEAGSGFLIFEKDNPSGLPENAASFEIPVRFTE